MRGCLRFNDTPSVFCSTFNPEVGDRLQVCVACEVAMCYPISRSPNVVFRLRGSVDDFPLRCFVGVYRKLHGAGQL